MSHNGGSNYLVIIKRIVIPHPCILKVMLH